MALLYSQIYIALVSKDIRVERIGITKRSRVPYLIYYIGNSDRKRSIFIKRAKFYELLRIYLSLKNQDGSVVVLGAIITDFDGIQVTTGEGQVIIPRALFAAFVSRYNRVAIQQLEVRLTSVDAQVRNPQTRIISIVDESECSCDDLYTTSGICPHMIAVHLRIQLDGWGTLREYFQPLGFDSLSEEQLLIQSSWSSNGSLNSLEGGPKAV